MLIGIGLDLNTTNFHLRWSMGERASAWNDSQRLELANDELKRWTEELKDAAVPALTANKTMGSLGGLIASRIARAFGIGGPSFTVSCDETSGVQALAIAVGWLERGELDAVIVGAVDFAGDARAVIARHQLDSDPNRSNGTPPDRTSGNPLVSTACDGAVALVVKRLADAKRDGDRIYAIIGDVATACKGAYERTSDDRSRFSSAHEIETIGSDLGHAGAALGLASVAKAALCLNRRILPNEGTGAGPQFWMRNRAEGQRRARVSVASRGGNVGHIILEEHEESPIPTQRDFRPAMKQAGLFAVEADDESGLGDRLRELREMAGALSVRDIDALARQWWQRHPNDPRLRLGKGIVADSVPSLERILDRVVHELHGQEGRAAAARAPLVPKRLAFVYPGLGNHFAGMGRDLAALFPEILGRHDAESGFLREQFDPRVWWQDELPPAFADHRVPISGSVSVGAVMTDVLRGLGVCPDAAIGYSLGESTALVALRAWTDRDELWRRLQSSPLFHTELAGQCAAARRQWNIPASEPVDWVAGIVPRSAEAVRAAIGIRRHVYVLISNSAEESVVGGRRRVVQEVIKKLQSAFVELPTVSTVHCEIGRSVQADYRALHDLETTAPVGIDFYSGAWGRPYVVDRESAADAITAQAIATIDFKAVIERAYADGIGVFLEVGPGSSCTRLIGQILGGRPHLAFSACRPDRDPAVALLEVVAGLIAHRAAVDLSRLYDQPTEHENTFDRDSSPGGDGWRRTIRVEVRGKEFHVPSLPVRRAILSDAIGSLMDRDLVEARAVPDLDSIHSPLNAVARSGDGEPPGEPQLNPAGTEPRPPAITQGDLAQAVHGAEQATQARKPSCGWRTAPAI